METCTENSCENDGINSCSKCGDLYCEEHYKKYHNSQKVCWCL